LNERQKQVLLDIYLSFRRENEHATGTQSAEKSEHRTAPRGLIGERRADPTPTSTP
jgi:hypothetical protein